jgi:hypothetical protein
MILCRSREVEPFQPPVICGQLQRDRTDHHTLGRIVLLLRMHPHNRLIHKPDIQPPDSCNEVQRQAEEGNQQTHHQDALPSEPNTATPIIISNDRCTCASSSQHAYCHSSSMKIVPQTMNKHPGTLLGQQQSVDIQGLADGSADCGPNHTCSE